MDRGALKIAACVALVVLAAYTIVMHAQRMYHGMVCVADGPAPPIAGPNNQRRLHVATIVTDTDNEGLRTLLRGAAFHGVYVQVIISPRPFGTIHGWGPRLRLLRSYLNTLPANDVVMFIDGYDVLVDGSPDALLAAFDRLVGSAPKIVFAAEANCHPDAHVAPRYPRTDSPYKFLNGGSYMATAGVLRDMLDKHMKFKDPGFDKVDDQREWTRVFLTTDDIVLDTGNVMFNCLKRREDDLTPTKDGWYNKATKSFPLVFHGNGTTSEFLFDTVAPHTRFGMASSTPTPAVTGT